MSSATVDHPDDVEPLRLLASAVAGRSVEVDLAAPGDRTWTDGATIHLDPGADPEERVRQVTVQAALLSAGSLDSGIVDRLRRPRGLADRYLAVEGHRALAVLDDILPPAVRGIVDHDLARRASTPEEALVLAQQAATAELPRAFGTIEPRRVRREAVDAPTEQDAAQVGVVQAEALDLPELEEDDDDTSTDLGNLLSSPVGGGGAVGRLLKRLLRPGGHTGDGGPPGADAATHLSKGGLGTRGRTLSARGGPVEAAPGDPPDSTGTTYPEWDVHRGAYREGWCTVVEQRPEVEPGALALTSPLALRRSLTRLSMGLTPVRRRRQGDDIDLDAAVEAFVDTAAGVAHEGDTYIENLHRRRDLSVVVLLDVSGSSAEPGVGGRSVHEHQREVAGALTATLHRLGDRVALRAFNSRGRTAVQVMRIKDFGEPVDAAVAHRLDALTPGGYTRLGAAIRHAATEVLERGGTPRRLLVVLSDGFAYDHGYHGRYGEADARKALDEARRRGVGCLCLSVGTDTDVAALRRVFGSTAHAVVPRADHLPAVVGPLFAAAVGAAEAQRRRFQRTERTRERLELERSTHA